jgi:hypothetical protein
MGREYLLARNPDYIDLGKDGSKWGHGFVPLNAAAVAIKNHKKVGGFKEIRKADLSTPDARRSRPVSSTEFQRIAAKGAVQYAGLKKDASPTTGLKDNWSSIVDSSYKEALKPWGGTTIDAHTGKILSSKADKYALTAREPGVQSVTLPENASRAEFETAMMTAHDKFKSTLENKDHYLGVFHNNDTGKIEIDPVVVVHDKKSVETIGAYTHATGGAYHFKSGDGYWPPHVAEPNVAQKAADERATAQAQKDVNILKSFGVTLPKVGLGSYNAAADAGVTLSHTLRVISIRYGADRTKWPLNVLKAAAPLDAVAQIALGKLGKGAKVPNGKLK